jgi:hypothetical protein
MFRLGGSIRNVKPKDPTHTLNALAITSKAITSKAKLYKHTYVNKNHVLIKHAHNGLTKYNDINDENKEKLKFVEDEAIDENDEDEGENKFNLKYHVENEDENDDNIDQDWEDEDSEAEDTEDEDSEESNSNES